MKQDLTYSPLSIRIAGVDVLPLYVLALTVVSLAALLREPVTLLLARFG